MRLDQFLRASRLVLRRAVAQELCAASAVTVNGVVARASRTVRVGDEITVRRSDRLLSVRVHSIPTVRQIARAAAHELYEIIREEKLSEPE